MKLSKNHKHFLSIALKENNTNYYNLDTKTASICLYSSDIIVNLAEKDLSKLNLELDRIHCFSDLNFLFLNEVNQKVLLSKTVIRSENPFITSMLNINKTAKIKYFIELICLNKIIINPDYEFFEDFFEKLHKSNFLYLYHTNKLDEIAEIRFILQVEDFYQKTFLISKNTIENEEDFYRYEMNINNEISKKTESMGNKKMSNNNSTIKEVSEDMLGNNESIKMEKNQNKDSLCNIGINDNLNENSNLNINRNNNFNNFNTHISDNHELNKNNINTHILDNPQLNNNYNDNNYGKNITQINSSHSLKKNTNLDKNSDFLYENQKNSNSLENRKNSNLLIFKTKNSSENHNTSSVYNHLNQNNEKRHQTNTNSKIELFTNENNDLLNENILGDFENMESKSILINLEKKDNTLHYDNNIDFNVEEKNENNEEVQPKFSGENSINKSDIKTHTPENENLKQENNQNKSKSVFLTGKDLDSQHNSKSEREVDINIDENNKTNSIKRKINSISKKSNENIFTDQNNNNDELNIQNMNQSFSNNDREKTHIPKKSFSNNDKEKTHSQKQSFSNNDKEKTHNISKGQLIRKFSSIYQNENHNYAYDNNYQNNTNEMEENKYFKIETNDYYQNANENINLLSEDKTNNNTNNVNKFGSTNGTFNCTKTHEFPLDEIYEINFNIGSYHYIYIDMNFSVGKDMETSLEKICSFIQWAWENFRYIKIVLYLPKIGEYFLNLNKTIMNDLNEIFSIADILLFEKKDIVSYKKLLKEISDIKKNTIYANFNILNINNSNSIIFGSNINDRFLQREERVENKWEEFFLNEFKIKKRNVPLIVYPTKTLVVIDELKNIFIYEKNYENKIIFKTENEFNLYPQKINHTNQNIISMYKSCLKENYFELRGIFFGAFLSKIMQKPVKVDTIISRDYTGGYLLSIELTKKFLKIFFNQNPYPTKNEFYLIKLDKILANTKLSEDVHRRRETKFVLDCVNQKKSYLKFYQPLNDYYLKDFFDGRSVSNTMKNYGYVKNNGGKFIEPEKNENKKKMDSIKIDGKFYIKNASNSPTKLSFNNGNRFNNSNSNLSNFNQQNRVNTVNDIDSSNNNLTGNIGKFNFNHSNNNPLTGFSNYNKTEKKGNNPLLMKKLNQIDVKSINFNSIVNFSKTSKNFFMQNNKRLADVFSRNVTVCLPKLVTPTVKIDPEEQMRNYVEFEKNLIKYQ